MWAVWKQDDQAIHYWNLEAALEVRFLKLSVLVDGYRTVLEQRGVSPAELGDPESLVMVLIGPPFEDFRIIARVPAGPDQQRKFAALEQAVRDAMASGVRLLDLRKVMESA